MHIDLFISEESEIFCCTSRILTSDAIPPHGSSPNLPARRAGRLLYLRKAFVMITFLPLDEICKKTPSAISALKRVRPFIPTEVAVPIYNALILLHFDYCSPDWDYMSGYLSGYFKLQNHKIALPELLLNHLLIRAPTSF